VQLDKLISTKPCAHRFGGLQVTVARLVPLDSAPCDTLCVKNLPTADRSKITRLVILIVFAFGGVSRCPGEQGAPAQDAASRPYTLHVYEDQVQVPTLVLNAQQGSYPNLGPKDFAITLDGGPPFHPSHLRLQGDDPMNLAVLMDASASGGLSLSLMKAASKLTADILSPRDSLSVFAFDCNLIRSGLALPASSSALASKAEEALQYPTLHRSRNRNSGCGKRFGLWDAIGEVARDMQDLPGRKVVLVLTDGKNTESKNTWETVRHFTVTFSIAVFALRPPLQADLSFGILSPGQVSADFEEKLGLLCNGTGGLSLTATPQTLAPMISRVIGLLRGRYILEFPRASNQVVGYHEIAVTVNDPIAIVRVSGVSVPLRDPHLLEDPSTVPIDTTKEPVMGTGRILFPPKQ
jgi:hypothetical protein